MPQIAAVNVDVYVVSKEQGAIRHLLLRRAPDRLYAGSWRMVAGKIREGEQAWQAAVRELWEETGLPPSELFAVPSLNRFYEWQTDRLHLIPAFAARVEADPKLNAEHDEFEWLPRDEASRRLAWPEQRRILTLVDEMFEAESFPTATRIPV